MQIKSNSLMLVLIFTAHGIQAMQFTSNAASSSHSSRSLNAEEKIMRNDRLALINKYQPQDAFSPMNECLVAIDPERIMLEKQKLRLEIRVAKKTLRNNDDLLEKIEQMNREMEQFKAETNKQIARLDSMIKGAQQKPSSSAALMLSQKARKLTAQRRSLDALTVNTATTPK